MKERQLTIISKSDVFEIYTEDGKREEVEDLETLLSLLRCLDTRDLQKQPIYQNVTEGDKVIIEGYRKKVREERSATVKELEPYK